MFDIRLALYDRDTFVKIIPQAQDIQASMPLNDTGAINFTIPTDVENSIPYSEILTWLDKYDLSLQWSDDSGGWWEAPGCRFVFANDSSNITAVRDQYSLSGVTTDFDLTGMLRLDTNHLNKEGNYVYKAATPGSILITMLSNAQSNNLGTAIKWDFTADKDSSGTAWPTKVTMDIDPAITVRQVIERLETQGVIDWRMNGFTLQAYVSDKGLRVSKNVEFVVGREVDSGPQKRDRSSMANVALVTGDGGKTMIRTLPTNARRGGRATTVSQAGVTDTATMTILADATLSALATPSEQLTREFTVTRDMVTFPLKDFVPGDIIWANGAGGGLEQLRVHQITISRTVGDDGGVSGNIVLADRFLENQLKQKRRIDALASSNVSGGSGGTPTPAPRPALFVKPKAPTNLEVTADAYLTATRDPSAVMYATWENVTQDINGATLDSTVKYEVGARAKSEMVWGGNIGLTVWPETTALTASHGDFSPDTVYRVAVRARTSDGVSDWSDMVEITTPHDTDPPQPPSAPVLTTKLGTVSASWDGRDKNGTITWPVDFNGVVLYNGDTKVAELNNGVTSAVLGSFLAGSTASATFTAVDVWGNESGHSEASTIVVKSVLDDTSYASDMAGLQGSIEDDYNGKIADVVDLANTAQATGDAANAAAAQAAGIANGKGDVLIQNTEPATTMRKATTLWIDTTNGGNIPKKWSGSAWGAVTDKTAIDAAQMAATAKSAAEAAQAAADANARDLNNFTRTVNQSLGDLQNQVDGSIATWFYAVPPTNTNTPAKNWTTTDLKNNHLGDLYYDTNSGYCYRWQVQSNTYSWSRITDVDVTKALSDAAKAQDTADGKRRVFTTTPVPPYDIGDLWAGGASADLMRCRVAKAATQSYTASDWEKATKYTDDSAANTAKDNAAAAQAAADAAQKKADLAYANSPNYITDTQFLTNADGVKYLVANHSDANALPLPESYTTYGKLTNNDNWTDKLLVQTQPGHTYRLEVWAKKASDETGWATGSAFGLMVWFLTSDGYSSQSYIGNSFPDNATTLADWRHLVWEWTAPADGSKPCFRPSLRGGGMKTLVTGFKVTDITEAKALQAAASAAQTAADNAQAAANNAQSSADKTAAASASRTNYVHDPGFVNLFQSGDAIWRWGGTFTFQTSEWTAGSMTPGVSSSLRILALTNNSQTTAGCDFFSNMDVSIDPSSGPAGWRYVPLKKGIPVYIAVLALASSRASFTTRLSAAVRRSNGVVISGSAATLVTKTLDSTKWQWFEGTFTPSADGYLTASLRTMDGSWVANTTSIYLSGLFVSPNIPPDNMYNAKTPFFCGSSPDRTDSYGNILRSAWTGEPNNSVSVESANMNNSALAEAAQAAWLKAGLAQTSANGKADIYHSKTTPPGTDHPDGSTWFVQASDSVGSDIVQTARWDATSKTWKVGLLGPNAVSAVDLGKATVGQLDGRYIKAETIKTDALQIGAVTTDVLASNAITTVKIADGAITGGKITVDTALAQSIAAKLVTADVVNAGSITGVMLTSDAINGKTITGATITGGTVQTEAAENRGVKITTNGIKAYNFIGVNTLSIDGMNNHIVGDFYSNIPGQPQVAIVNVTRTGQPGVWFSPDGNVSDSTAAIYRDIFGTLNIRGDGGKDARSVLVQSIATGPGFNVQHDINQVANPDGSFTCSSNGDSTISVTNILDPKNSSTPSFSGMSTVSYNANCFIDNSNRLYKYSSSRDIKLDITDLDVDPEKILDIRPVKFHDRLAYEEPEIGLPKDWVPGLIAEEVDDLGLGIFVPKDENGKVSGFDYDRLWILLVPVVKNLKARVDELEGRLQNGDSD